MRKQGILTSVCLLCCLLSTTVVCGQERDQVQEAKQNMVLTKSLLQEATAIEYYSDMGTIPQARDCRITVKKDTIKVVMTEGRGMNNVVVSDEISPLTDEQYQLFINMLAALKLEKKDPPEVPGLGGSVSYIEVRKDTEILFSGEERYTLMDNHGALFETFLKILPDDWVKRIHIHLQR